MPRIYLLVYLIYGIVYILMGLIALASSRSTKKFQFYQNIIYLGIFAIIHGISELMTVIVISDLYSEFTLFLFISKRVLKALSFIYLFKFAICFYTQSQKSWKCKIPEIFFGLWFITLMVVLSLNYDIESLSQFFDVTIRYMMAFPMSLFVSYTLFNIKDRYPSIVGLRNILYLLSILFLIYGIVDGLFVRKAAYFPASYINNELFRSMFLIPIQYVKIAIGLAACILFYQSDVSIRNYEVIQLTKYQKKLASESERARLHNMIHDKTIQKLFSSGLLLETLTNDSNEENPVVKLAVSQLNECIDDLRQVIYDDRLDVDKSLSQICEEMILDWQVISSLKLAFSLHASSSFETQISAYQKIHCTWIIQEMLVNAIKHSKGTFCHILIEENEQNLHIKAMDDGVGFRNPGKKSEMKHGLISLIDRTRQLKGTYGIESVKGSTVVWVTFPVKG